MTGTRLGNWILGESLGRSSTGTIYRAQAFELKPDEPAFAAVKILDGVLARDPAFQQRFPGELLALHRLTHPNLTRFYDAGVQAGLVYYACELAPGTNLDTILAQREKSEPGLPWPTTVYRIAVQVARALKHAHHRSILHRDLKPANLILADDGTVKVTDFGVAKAFAVPPLALPTEPLGTICYLAPEHFTGKPLTRKSDLYALGGVLYTLVCGRAPFTAATTAEYMHKHCYMLPDRPIHFVPKLPVEVDELICSLLAKDPARRPASAAALLDELEHLRGKLERKGERLLPPPEEVDPTGQHAPLVLTESEPPPAGNDSARARGRILRGGLLSLLLLIVVGLILYAFFRPRPSAEELWDQAQPLLASDNPEDWDKARAEYLDKLERWHPGTYESELAALRERANDRRELKRVFTIGANFKGSDAERLYRKGLLLVQVGDYSEATEVWKTLIATSTDRRWVTLAETGLSEIAKQHR